MNAPPPTASSPPILTARSHIGKAKLRGDWQSDVLPALLLRSETFRSSPSSGESLSLSLDDIESGNVSLWTVWEGDEHAASPSDAATAVCSSSPVVAVKIVWIPPWFTTFVVVDHDGRALNVGVPTSASLPPLGERVKNFRFVEHTEYGRFAKGLLCRWRNDTNSNTTAAALDETKKKAAAANMLGDLSSSSPDEDDAANEIELFLARLQLDSTSQAEKMLLVAEKNVCELISAEERVRNELLATAESAAEALIVGAQLVVEERERMMDEVIARKLQDSEEASRDIIARAKATARDILAKAGIVDELFVSENY